MVSYTTTILKFGKKGEKTGWTYIEVPVDIATKLKKGFKKSFRVKGKLDDFSFKGAALIPMGEGEFILPLNADFRKGIKKKEGAMLKVQMTEDKAEFQFNKDFMDCLADDKKAEKHFASLSGSHQKYFSKWIDSAKTEETKTNRIAKAINALSRNMGYPEMLREGKKAEN